MPYFGLARGFLTGKYRPDGPRVESARAAGALAYLDDRGIAVLDALDEIARPHRTTPGGRGARLAGGAADRRRADRERPDPGAAGRPAADGEHRARRADELARLDAASA